MTQTSRTIIELDPGVNIDNDLAFVDTQSKKACNIIWTEGLTTDFQVFTMWYGIE